VQFRIFDFNIVISMYKKIFYTKCTCILSDTTICEITEHFYGFYFFISKTRQTYVQHISISMIE